MQRMNELAFYTLAGNAESPRVLLDEVRRGEELGFGSVFISERFNVKEAVTLSGAAGAVATEIFAVIRSGSSCCDATAPRAVKRVSASPRSAALGGVNSVRPELRVFDLHGLVECDVWRRHADPR